MTIDSDNSSDSARQLSPVVVGWLAAAAVVTAAVPHFFLDPPILLYNQQNLQAWLGLTVWAPTFLGAVALFLGVELSAGCSTPAIASVDGRIAAGVSAPIVVVVCLAWINFDGFQHVGSLWRLTMAMGVYGATFAVGCMFWQGIVQHRLLARWPAALRAVGVAVVAAGVWMPFLANQPWARVSTIVVEFGIVYLALAVLYELGLSVLACMASALVMGVAWGWAHQMTFF